MPKVRYSLVLLGILGVGVACGGRKETGYGPPSPSAAPQGEEQSAQPQASVRAGDLSVSRAHYESVVEMLRGQVPGLEIVENEAGRVEVRIRGLNQSLQTNAEGVSTAQEPLVVVDGVPQSRGAGEVLLSLNPVDVAQISVLRDVSSTAVYGTRGANGVILVRLKKRS